MQRVQHFVKQAVIGGLLVIAPAVILFLIFSWVFRSLRSMISPITTPIVERTALSPLGVDLATLLLILGLCFLLGTITSTGMGRWLHNRCDHYYARYAPGYRLVKDIINQLLGDPESTFGRGEVALVQLFGGSVETRVTAIVTSRHDNGWFTVFMPTGPNPTSGLIFHLPPEQVELLPSVKVDEALKTVISCGAGTHAMLSGRRVDSVAQAIREEERGGH